MQITSLEMMLGFTANLGDFQSAKAEVRMSAMLAPGDDLADSCEYMRRLLTGELNANLEAKGAKAISGPSKATEPAHNGEAKPAAKRGRPTNAELAAKQAEVQQANKAAAERMKAAGDQLGDAPAELGEETMSDDTAALLGDEIPEQQEITYDQLRAALTKLANAKGAPALQKIFRKFGAASIKALKPEIYADAYREAEVVMSQ